MTCCASSHHRSNVPIISERKIFALILDLDGTLLDTERATRDVRNEFLAKYGRSLDKEKEEKKPIGMTLKESSLSFVNDYDLPLTPDQFIQEIIPMYQQKWRYAKSLPGVNRLIKHLHNHGIPFALASNSLRDYIDKKISYHEGWKEYFSVILGSDQVKAGKPSPDLFEEAAKRLGVDPTRCLVIEDSMVGVKAANAAKMAVVAIPPQAEASCGSLANIVLRSLLEFQPELWGLPPFEDWINKALPIEPINTRGVHVNGVLHEITDDGKSSLPDQVFGVFFGCAEVDSQKIFNVVVLIDNQKVIKIHMIIEGRNFTMPNQNMKLELLGYIKGLTEENTWLEMDTEILEEYKLIARASMTLPAFIKNSKILSQ